MDEKDNILQLIKKLNKKQNNIKCMKNKIKNAVKKSILQETVSFLKNDTLRNRFPQLISQRKHTKKIIKKSIPMCEN